MRIGDREGSFSVLGGGRVKPRLLDLFSCAGIGADGYAAAGFEVECVDISPQPNNPYFFKQGDANDVLAYWECNRHFYAISASPPCQAHTRAKHLRDAQNGESRFEDLLTPTLAQLRSMFLEIPWIVENVPGAPMEPIDGEWLTTLCGSMFGLGVRRHRKFLTNWPLEAPSPCRHREQGRPWGVYHVPADDIPCGGRTARNLEHGKEVMGVPLERQVTWNELKEAIPPAYTEWIGLQLLNHLEDG